MDIARSVEERQKQKTRNYLWGLALVGLIIACFAILNYLPSQVQSVPGASLWEGTVKRGVMKREVRGAGSLIAEDSRLVTALVSGVVARLALQPGDQVDPNSLVLVLTNPQLEFEVGEAEAAVAAAKAELSELRFELEHKVLDRKANLARLQTDHELAVLTADRDEELGRREILPHLTVRISRLKAESLAKLVELEQQQLAKIETSVKDRIASKQTRIDQLQEAVFLKQNRAQGLQVRAGISGVLQDLPLEVGQRVDAGDLLAEIVDPTRLEARVRIPQNQTGGLRVGLAAVIDTHNGTVPARVTRVDPSVKEDMVAVVLAPLGPWPEQARPDLAVEGIVELERIPDTLYVDKPVYARADSEMLVFKLIRDETEATPQKVRFGKQSVKLIEILSGLQEGDRIILSDISDYRDHPRIAIER